jgi:hypothetical protein
MRASYMTVKASRWLELRIPSAPILTLLERIPLAGIDKTLTSTLTLLLPDDNRSINPDAR